MQASPPKKREQVLYLFVNLVCLHVFFQSFNKIIGKKNNFHRFFSLFPAISRVPKMAKGKFQSSLAIESFDLQMNGLICIYSITIQISKAMLSEIKNSYDSSITSKCCNSRSQHEPEAKLKLTSIYLGQVVQANF
ncbi:hypothetical protein DM860_010368 [Cuscuta australis]|uniref:Uncharacterized protein n=1 Tax=Cuscuta australis TaxID=267555 RepID=A0A328E2C6_9ASTE|nr:hypothetical protein DM860_010368 [Cuscuta australis]